MTPTCPDVVVVGSGPNGLAAAIELARAGRSVRLVEAGAAPGGGCRTVPLPGFPWLQRDPCAAVHPLAAASPFFRTRPARFRPMLAEPPFALAHLLGPGGPGARRDRASSPCPTGPPQAALVFPRDLSRLVDINDPDFPATAWVDAFDPLARRADEVVSALLTGRLSGAALRAIWRFGHTMYRHLLGAPDGPVASAFAGLAVHAIAPPQRPIAFGSGVLLAATLHGRGWPIPLGGSGAIVDGLLGELESLGVSVECGRRITSLDELDHTTATGRRVQPLVVLALGAAEAARIIDNSNRPRAGIAARWLAAMPRGGAAARVDFALRGPVPWRDPRVAEAGTVHLTGTAREAAAAERQIARGIVPDRLPILISQPWTADSGRIARTAPADAAGARSGTATCAGPADRVLWTYAHVPHGFTGSLLDRISTQIEAHAPGFRDVVAGGFESRPVDLERYNPSYAGGDIAAGAATVAGMAHRLSTGWGQVPALQGVWLCGASTLPGPGVHGMSGVAVAAAVNKWLDRAASHHR